jgi:hypothetical protein
LVVLDHEQDGQAPDRRQVRRLVEVALAGAAVADEGGRDPARTLELRREGQPVRDRQHRAQMADHPDDALVQRAEMERAVAPGGEASVLAEELPEETAEVQAAAGEDAQVAVQGQDPVVRLERGRHADRDRLLAHPGEPLRKASLPEQQQRLLFDQTRQQERAVQLAQTLRTEAGRRRGVRRLHCSWHGGCVHRPRVGAVGHAPI